MKSLIHCFWCGPSFPYHLRQFIKIWVHHLRKSNSEFQLVVWATQDTMHFASEYLSTGLGNSLNMSNSGRLIPEVDVVVSPASLGFNKFYIAPIEPLLTSIPFQLSGIFQKFHDKKRYTSASNIGRLVIVNACGGVYTDVDYLLPSKGAIFPKNIDQLLEPLKMRNRHGFYLPAVDLKSQILIENQCAIIDPRMKNSLVPLFERMAKFVETFRRKIAIEIDNNLEYVANPKTQSLNSSLFTEETHTRLMHAFRDRDYITYLDICDEIYRNEHLSGASPKVGDVGFHTQETILFRGTRHKSYHYGGMATYSIPANFFNENIKGSLKSYCNNNWAQFKQFFDTQSIDDQFQFIDDKGQIQGMYSWANPGYSRLSSLSKVVDKVKTKYMEHHNLMPKQPLLALITVATNEGFGFLESHRERSAMLAELQRELTLQHHNALDINMVMIFFKRFLWIVIHKGGSIGKNKMSEIITQHLNTQNYKPYRDLIDPEKSQLTFEDLVSFII